MTDISPLVRAERLTVTVARRDAAAFTLGPIDLAIAAGETLVVSGPSSSGKTLLLGTLAGHHRPTHGTVTITLAAHAPRIHVVPQAVSLIGGLTIGENVLLDTRLGLADDPPADWLERIVADLNLGALWTREPDEVSYGEAHRVMLARSLAARPTVRLVDEPFAHQDPEMCTTIASLLDDATTAESCCVVATRREHPELLQNAATHLALVGSR